MRIKIPAVVALVFGIVALLNTGCTQEPAKYDYGLSIAGGPTGWPVWVEDLTFDGSWGAPIGSLRAGFDQRPPGGAMVAMSPKPVPENIEAYWFSYRTQTFYRINLTLPGDLEQQIKGWYEKYPLPTYRHYLILGFSGKGEALVWWRSRCMDCGTDRSQDFTTPIVESARGRKVEGNPARFQERTQQHVEEGTIPEPDNNRLGNQR
jgi:hypothetical protein